MKKKASTDQIYKQPIVEIKPFVFDRKVTEVFDDMISRSVPGYHTILEMLAVLTRQFSCSGTNIYDLGCSTGTSSLVIAANLTADDTKLILVDNSESMVNACQRVFSKEPDYNNITILCEDIMETSITNASIVYLNLTLQFLAPKDRTVMINKCFAGLRPGAVLVLVEKIVSRDPDQEALRNDLHWQYKMANGYSKLEISQKRTALEKTLIPETHETHLERLLNAGFCQIEQFFHCLNFSAYLAIKPLNHSASQDGGDQG